MGKFSILQSRGLPSPLVINDKLMRQDDYINKLYEYANNQASSFVSSSVSKELPTGKVRYDSLENIFYVEHEVKHLFPVQPNFVKYTEADAIFKKLTRTRIPRDDWWTNMIKIL